MTHSYTVEGITCEGCVAKVKHQLLLNPEITSAEVKLEGQKAIISMQRHLSLDELQDTIGRNTKYIIKEDATDHSYHHHATAEESERSWFETYKPILLIFAFITVVATISSAHKGIFRHDVHEQFPGRVLSGVLFLQTVESARFCR